MHGRAVLLLTATWIKRQWLNAKRCYLYFSHLSRAESGSENRGCLREARQGVLVRD